MILRRSFVLVFALSLLAQPAARPIAAQPRAVVDLQADVERILGSPGLERAFWGILVRSLDAGDTLYAMNPGKLMMPASVLKVITVAAAADRLGWNYSYETRLVADGAVNGDTLDGNLVIVGSGDPSLDRRTLDAWTAQLKAAGLARITGTVLVDNRAFAGEGLGAGWSWDDVPYYYAAPVAAAQFRENAVDLTLRPGGSPGAPPVYEFNPPGIAGLLVDNRMVTGAAAAMPEFVARRAPGSAVVVLEGVVPVGSRAVSHPLSVPDPGRYLAAGLTEALLAGGIAPGGPPPADATVDAAKNFAGAQALVTYRSAPLAVLARHLLEVSQNQYSESLLKTIGAQIGDATFAGGVKAEQMVLASWGIAADGAVLRDGSGLSRYNYVTPETLIGVMTHMYREPAHRETFFPLLNVAGRSGTIAGRMKDTPAAGNARAKDGLMAGVRSLCGLVTTADGETLAFAILANNFDVPGPTITAAIDAIVVRLAALRR